MTNYGHSVPSFQLDDKSFSGCILFPFQVHTGEPIAGDNLPCLRRQQALLHWRHSTCAGAASPASPQPPEGGGDDAGEGEHGAGGDEGEAGGEGGAAEELALRRLHIGERATGVLLRRVQHPEPLEVLEGLAGTQQGQRWMEIWGVDKKGSKVARII